MKYKIYARLTLLILCQITMLISYRCGSSAGGTVAGGGSGSGSGVTIGYFQLHFGANFADGDASGSDVGGEHNMVAVDSSGNIYLAGRAGGDFGEALANSGDILVIKLDKSGVHQWSAQLGEVSEDAINGDGSANGSEWTHSLDLDSSGNIYVTGSTNGALGEVVAGGFDAFVAKISSTGSFLWVSQIGESSEDALGGDGSADGSDVGRSIVVDSNGNIIIMGDTSGDLGEVGATSNDLFIARISSSGSYLWLTQLGEVTEDAFAGDGSADGTEEPKAQAVDSSGNSYITGVTSGSLGEAEAAWDDIFAMKTDITGTIQWVVQIGDVTDDGLSGNGSADGFDYGFAIALDSNEDVIVGGMCDGNIGEVGAGGEDYVLAKLTANGTFEWISQIGEATEDTLNGDTTADGSDELLAIALDASDNIYFLGTTDGALGETLAGVRDIVFGKASSDGTFLWVKQIGETTEDGLGGDSSADGFDWPRAMVWHSSGKLIIAGDTQGSLFDTLSGGRDLFIFSVDTDGNFVAP